MLSIRYVANEKYAKYFPKCIKVTADGRNKNSLTFSSHLPCQALWLFWEFITTILTR
jgi:hypothetical protein